MQTAKSELHTVSFADQMCCVGNKSDSEPACKGEESSKVKKRYFNFIVLQTPEGKTRIEQRKGKGIWQNLFQFPLIETTTSVSLPELISNESFQELVTGPHTRNSLVQPRRMGT